MFHLGMNDLEKYKSVVEKNLLEQIKYLKKMKFPQIQLIENFDVNDSSLSGDPESIRIKFQLPPSGHQVIYVISLKGFNSDIETFNSIIDGIAHVKKSFKDELSRITSITKKNFRFHGKNIKDEMVMYVGTSQTFSARLRTHVGHGSKDTATICLKHWPILKDKSDLLQIRYYDFGKEISPETLKLFESHLSRDLLPLIGRDRRA